MLSKPDRSFSSYPQFSMSIEERSSINKDPVALQYSIVIKVIFQGMQYLLVYLYMKHRIKLEAGMLHALACCCFFRSLDLGPDPRPRPGRFSRRPTPRLQCDVNSNRMQVLYCITTTADDSGFPRILYLVPDQT